VKVLVTGCLTLLEDNRSYDVAAYMAFSFITFFHTFLFPFFIIAFMV